MAIMDFLDDILGVDSTGDLDEIMKLYSEGETPDLNTPEYETLIKSALEDIPLESRTRDSQMRALDLISELAETGMTPEDEAVLNRINRQQDMEARGNREALVQQFARQGTGGSGASLANQMLANQSSADMAALRGLEQAGQASARRQGAIGQMAGQGGNLRAQDYGQQSQRAMAQDAISRFNTETQNRQMDMANQLAQQRFANEMQRKAGQAGAYDRRIMDTQQKRQGAYSALGSGAQTGGQMAAQAGAAAMMMSDENLKENIEDGNPGIQEFLSELSPKEYNYIDPIIGDGRYISPMAQELEKTKLGRDLVIDTPEGKMVDYGKGFGLMLSAMANISQRLDKIGV
jgi:hypothetical protein